MNTPGGYGPRGGPVHVLYLPSTQASNKRWNIEADP